MGQRAVASLGGCAGGVRPRCPPQGRHPRKGILKTFHTIYVVCNEKCFKKKNVYIGNYDLPNISKIKHISI